MEVNVLETTTIFPSHPPFDQDHILSLSHIDNDRNAQVTFRYLRAYINGSTTIPGGSDPVLVISKALSLALVHYYPFAGTLRRCSDDRFELFCAIGKGVPVIRATVNLSLASANYLDDPAAQFLEQLVPDPKSGDELLHPLVLQVTVFDCGGFTLGSCVHHSMADGLGATQFFNTMAEFARGMITQPSVEPVWDRARLLGPRDPPHVEVPFHEFLYLDKEFSPYSESTLPVTRECFEVRDECMERFKAILHGQSGSKFTTFEALGAFIWQARVKASGVEGDEKVKFAYLINMRKQLKPALPIGYWGNGCVTIYVQLTAKDLVEQPIWKTAELIKKSKRNATDEYVRSFIDFQQIHYSEGITAGTCVSGFTDWRHLGHSTVDFGWGPPVTVLPLTRNFIGSTEPCFFLPYSFANEGKKNDGFKVLVSFPEPAMPAFRIDMEKFKSEEELSCV